MTQNETPYHPLAAETLEFIGSPRKMLINNEWVASSSAETLDTLNPANGTVLTSVPSADETDVDLAVRAARSAFNNHWKNEISPAQRADLLFKLADLMERDTQIFVQLETLDNGKPLDKAAYDVLGAISHVKYYAGWATKIEGSTVPVGSDKLVYTQKEPLGVVGLIVPWNFPLMIALWKLAPALAGGNCCILKPAEQTPLTALYLGKLIVEAGFPAGVVNIITGGGIPTGQAMTRHRGIDKVSFTGSTEVGRNVLEESARSNLKRVSLELGGKSPNVIFDDANLEAALDSLPWSSFYNSGQECTLGSRVYVQESIYESVVASLKERAAKMTIGDGFDNPDLGPMISEEQLETVVNYIRVGQQEGATLVYGGARCNGALASGYFLEPTIFTTQDEDLTIVREEIFGPVVVISKFKDFEEAIRKANATEYGLAAAVWTSNLSQAHRFANAVEAGTVWINGYDLFDASVPFGGFKQSGNGKEMGKSAIDLYTREKSVWIVLNAPQ